MATPPQAHPLCRGLGQDDRGLLKGPRRLLPHLLWAGRGQTGHAHHRGHAHKQPRPLWCGSTPSQFSWFRLSHSPLATPTGSCQSTPSPALPFSPALCGSCQSPPSHAPAGRCCQSFPSHASPSALPHLTPVNNKPRPQEHTRPLALLSIIPKPRPQLLSIILKPRPQAAVNHSHAPMQLLSFPSHAPTPRSCQSSPSPAHPPLSASLRFLLAVPAAAPRAGGGALPGVRHGGGTGAAPEPPEASRRLLEAPEISRGFLEASGIGGGS